MDDRRTSTSLAWFLLLALALHIGFYFLKLPQGGGMLSYFTKSDKKEEKTFVIEQAPKMPDDRPIVQSSRSKDQDADDKKAKYAGEFRNRVKKETQSKRRGRFNEHTIVEHKGEGGEESPLEEPTERDGVEPSQRHSLRTPGLAMRDLMAFSSSPNALDRDVDEGEETMLNTDQVLYASFFNRIADEIYDTWVSHVRDAFHSVDFEGRKLPPKVYFTRLNIQMNASGTVTAITVLESCGIPELDDAAKKAFWEREPFINPPEQMMGKDGTMRFVYGFRADYRQSFFNITPWST